MIEAAQEILSGEKAWIVGGAVRDELLGRPVVDLDIACREPEPAARRYARRSEGAPFPLSERHGAWRVALDDGRTVDFTPLPNGIHEDLATRDFTINAIARPLEGGEPLDPFGGLGDLDRRTLRAVAPGVFRDDPLRLLRAVRLEEELGFRLDAETERLVQAGAGLVTKPAGERILAELERLDPAGFERLDALGLLAPLGGSLERLRSLGDTTSDMRLVAVFEDRLGQLPVSNELRRYAGKLLRAELPPDHLAAGDPPLSPRDGAVGGRRRRGSRAATRSWSARSRDARCDEPGGAAAPRRRARATSRPGDRRVARADRRGASGRDDLDPRGGARAGRRGGRRSDRHEPARSRFPRVRLSPLRSQRGGGRVRLNYDHLARKAASPST